MFDYVHHQMAVQKNYGNMLFYNEEWWKAKLLIKKMWRAEFSTRELLYEIIGREIKIG